MDHTPISKQKTRLEQSKLICCKVFISEARNRSALEAIERAAEEDPESVVVNKFEDRPYNRVRYDIVSYVVQGSSTATATANATATATANATAKATAAVYYSPLQRTVVAMAEAAFDSINLETHTGAHPRLGVVDDIVFHPLARASLDEAAWLAKAVALDIGTRIQVPVYLYAAAHPTGKALDSIRRGLGYYRPNFMGTQWAGWTMPEILPEKPDEGPSSVSKSRGITMIGARPWIALYNVPIMSTDLSAVRRIARRVSGRGGGLPSVQAMALAHGETVIEVACNLLDPFTMGGDRVQLEVERLAKEEGVTVAKGYFTHLSHDKIVESYLKLCSFI